MNQKLKTILKRIIPSALIIRPSDILLKVKINRVKTTFNRSATKPEFLEQQALFDLQKLYPPRTSYKYSEDSLLERGEERVEKLSKLITDKSINKYLELACWDGMVSYVLKQNGKETTAVDYRDIGFDIRAKDAGVNLLQMDAANLEFEDNSFDDVISYDAFEHFANPDKVLSEALRVVRKNGYVFLEFGPLYFSALGLHIYRDITVPYCQFLFTKEVMDDFLVNEGKPKVDYTHCNGWTLIQFREMFKKYSQHFETIIYNEIPNYQFIDLIEKHPSCFKSKTDNFENLTISSITVLLQKK